MVDLFVDLIKRDINEVIQTPQINFEQIHYIIRQNIEKLWLSDRKKYGEQITKYIEREQELNNKIKSLTDELIDLRKQLAGNDEKMYEAIKQL